MLNSMTAEAGMLGEGKITILVAFVYMYCGVVDDKLNPKEKWMSLMVIG